MPFGPYGGGFDYGDSYIDSPDPQFGGGGDDTPDVGLGIKRIKDKFGRVYEVPGEIASNPGMLKDFIMREREASPLKFNAPAHVQSQLLPSAPKPVIPMPEQPGFGQNMYNKAAHLAENINENANPIPFVQKITSQWPSETIDEFMDTQKAIYKDAGESWKNAQSVGDYVGAGTKYAEWALPPFGQMFYGAGKKFEQNDPIGGIGASVGIGAGMFGADAAMNGWRGGPKFGKPGTPDYEAIGPPEGLQAIHEPDPFGEVSNIPPDVSQMHGGGLQDVSPFVDEGHVPGLPSGETGFPGLHSVVEGANDSRYHKPIIPPTPRPSDRTAGSFAEYVRRADLALGRETPDQPQITNRDVFNNLVPESIKGPYLPSTNQSWMDAILPSAIDRDANFGLTEPGRVVTDPFTGQVTRHLPMGVRDTPNPTGIPEPPITERFRPEPPPQPIQPFEPPPTDLSPEAITPFNEQPPTPPIEPPPPIQEPPPAAPIAPIETAPPTVAEPIAPIQPPPEPIAPIAPPIEPTGPMHGPARPPVKISIRQAGDGFQIIHNGRAVGELKPSGDGWTHDGITISKDRASALKDFVSKNRDKLNAPSTKPPNPNPTAPDKVLYHPTAQQWLERVRELDAKGAPDTAYQMIMSTASKAPLKKGETWRGRVINGIAYFESQLKKPQAKLQAVTPFEPGEAGFNNDAAQIKEMMNRGENFDNAYVEVTRDYEQGDAYEKMYNHVFKGEESTGKPSEIPPEIPNEAGLNPVEDFGPGPHASVFDPYHKDTLGEQAPFKPGQDVHEFDPNIKPYDWNDEPFKSEVGHQQAFEPEKTLEDLQNPQKTAEIAQSAIDDAKKHVSGKDSPMDKAIAKAQEGVDAAAQRKTFANRQIEKASALKEGYNRYLGKSEEQTLADMGEGGKELVRTMQRVVSDAHNFAGKQGLAIEEAMKGMKKEQFAEAVDVVEGKTKSSDPKVNALADVMRTQLQEIGPGLYKVLKTKNPLTDRLYPFESRENYFPHRYPEGFSVSEQSVPDLIKAIQDEAAKDGKTITAERAKKIIDDAKESNYRTLDAMKSRLRDLPGYRKDFEVLMNHFIGMAKRSYEEIHLGEDTLQGAQDNHVHAQLDKIEKEFGHEARQRAEGIVSTFIDKSPTRTEGWQSTAAGALTSIQAFTKLSRSVIKNIPGGLTAGLTRGELVPWSKSIIAPFTKAGRDFAKESGTLVSLWRDSAKDIGYGSAGSKVFGVNMAEEYLRTFSGNLGKYEAETLFKRIKDDVASGKKLNKSELAQLDDLLVEKDPMSVFKQDKLSDEQLARAANRMTDLTQGRADSLALPQKWTNNPSANILTQFKKFGFIQARNMKNALIQNPKAIPRVLAIQQVLGLGANMASAALTGRKMAKGIGLLVEDASYAFGFGMISDLMQAAAGGGQRFITALAGPTVSDIGEIADVGKEVWNSKKHGLKRLEPIAEFGAKRIPFFGAAIGRRMNEANKAK